MNPIDPKYIVSDLHVGDGGPLEDFVHERDFIAFLEQIDAAARRQGRVAELVIAGDGFDFLQVEPLRHGPWREAHGKIGRVTRAHPALFDATARFLARGNRIVVLVGNHDVELAFGEVQATLRRALAGGDPAAAERVIFPNDQPLGPHFRGWGRGPFVYRDEGLYVEHGNQWDPANFFDHTEFYADAGATIVKDPGGSTFVRDLFNGVEAEYPFIDKVRPRTAAILLLWLMAPRLVRERLPTLRALGPRLYTELRRYAREVPGVAGAGAKGRAKGRGAEGDILVALGPHADDLEIIDRFGATAGPLQEMGSKSLERLPRRVEEAYVSIFCAALQQMTSRRERLDDDDRYAAQALELGRAEGAEVVVFGHTHGLRKIIKGGCCYLNTGTWIGLLDLDYEALMAQPGPTFRDVLERLRSPEAFVPLRLLSFVEIAYPHGQLTASLKIFGNGAASPVEWR